MEFSLKQGWLTCSLLCHDYLDQDCAEVDVAGLGTQPVSIGFCIGTDHSYILQPIL